MATVVTYPITLTTPCATTPVVSPAAVQGPIELPAIGSRWTIRSGDGKRSYLCAITGAARSGISLLEDGKPDSEPLVLAVEDWDKRPKAPLPEEKPEQVISGNLHGYDHPARYLKASRRRSLKSALRLLLLGAALSHPKEAKNAWEFISSTARAGWVWYSA